MKANRFTGNAKPNTNATLFLISDLRVLIFALGLFISIDSFSQNYRIDSLKEILLKKSDVNRVKALEALCYQWNSTGRPDSLKKYADELLSLSQTKHDLLNQSLAMFYLAQVNRKDSTVFMRYSTASLAMAKQHNFKKAIALNYLGRGNRWRVTGEYSKGIQVLQEGIALMQSESDKQSQEILADLNSALSSIYHNQGNYTEALPFALEANRMAEKFLDTVRLIKSYNNLSAVYGELSSSENGLGSTEDRIRYRVNAKAFTRKSFEVSLNQPNQRMPAVAAYNLGLILNEENNRDSSNVYLRSAIQIGLPIKYYELLANANSVIGLNFEKTNSDSALYYFEKSIQYARQSELTPLVASMLVNKARILEQRGQLTEANALANESLALNQGTDELDGLMASYQLLSTLAEKSGDLRGALHYHRLYVSLKDSILNQKNFARLEEVKTRFETALKDKEISTLSQQAVIQDIKIRQRNYLLLSLSLLIVVVTGFVFLFVRQRQSAAREKILDMENRFLRSQLNPHFLFNALSAIQQFIYTQPDRTIAADYLGKFSSLTRKILNYSREEFISLEQEVEFLNDYLELQKIRFDVPFTHSINIESSLDAENVFLPPMITQPFIENSIEHGILHKQEQGRLSISFNVKSNSLEISIEDNGVGREKTAFVKRNEKHRSLATQVTRERLANLERQYKQKTLLSIEDLLDDKQQVCGTRVVFNLLLIQDI